MYFKSNRNYNPSVCNKLKKKLQNEKAQCRLSGNPALDGVEPNGKWQIQKSRSLMFFCGYRPEASDKWHQVHYFPFRRDVVQIVAALVRLGSTLHWLFFNCNQSTENTVRIRHIHYGRQDYVMSSLSRSRVSAGQHTVSPVLVHIMLLILLIYILVRI